MGQDKMITMTIHIFGTPFEVEIPRNWTPFFRWGQDKIIATILLLGLPLKWRSHTHTHTHTHWLLTWPMTLHSGVEVQQTSGPGWLVGLGQVWSETRRPSISTGVKATVLTKNFFDVRLYKGLYRKELHGWANLYIPREPGRICRLV
jgi:hypothetical protein